MASADSSLQLVARALWDPKPTTDDKSARYLAAALGYPGSWRVVRKIDQKPTNDSEKDKSGEQGQTQNVIVDRIYAGLPTSGVDMWFNHHAAQLAAEQWVEGHSKGYENKGGQLLPRKPKFQIGDQVKVKYQGEWFQASIKRRKEFDEGFRYSVYYPKDTSTQHQVPEDMIALIDNPQEMATQMGLEAGWQAKINKGKWTFISPDGKVIKSKKAALAYQKKEKSKPKQQRQDQLSEGDPPWRTTGHDLLGRLILWTTQHKKSATRTITIEQVGKVVGWISDTDVDQHGEPGFISEHTGKPAKLFHIVFEDDSNHPYAAHLVERTDLEEEEITMNLMPADDPPKKKAKIK